MQVHHVGYLVKNMMRAEKDFTLLGYVRETEVIYDPIRQVDISFWTNGGLRVELVSPKTKESPVYDLLKVCKNMPYHVCYVSEDLAADAATLRENGYFPVGEPAPAPAIGGQTVWFWMSGQTGMIELLEKRP